MNQKENKICKAQGVSETHQSQDALKTEMIHRAPLQGCIDSNNCWDQEMLWLVH